MKDKRDTKPGRLAPEVFEIASKHGQYGETLSDVILRLMKLGVASASRTKKPDSKKIS